MISICEHPLLVSRRYRFVFVYSGFDEFPCQMLGLRRVAARRLLPPPLPDHSPKSNRISYTYSSRQELKLYLPASTRAVDQPVQASRGPSTGRGTRRTPTPDPPASASRRSLGQQPSSLPSKMDRQANQGSSAEPTPACETGEHLVQCALCTDDVRRTPE